MAAGASSIRELARCTLWRKPRAMWRARARRPIAATNCLNFGNPEKPEVMWQFSEAIDGIGEACRALDTPITGGNVSFYNETLGKPIYPTPVLGVLGLLENAEDALGSGFRNEGDLDCSSRWRCSSRFRGCRQMRTDEFASSEYAKTIHGVIAGSCPAIDLARGKAADRLPSKARERTRCPVRARYQRWWHRRNPRGIMFHKRRLSIFPLDVSARR